MFKFPRSNITSVLVLVILRATLLGRVMYVSSVPNWNEQFLGSLNASEKEILACRGGVILTILSVANVLVEPVYLKTMTGRKCTSVFILTDSVQR